MVHNSVVEELALIASARQFWWIVLEAIPSEYSTGLAAIPSECSTGRCWQTGRTREQTVVLFLVAGRQLLGQVFVYDTIIYIARLQTFFQSVLC